MAEPKNLPDCRKLFVNGEQVTPCKKQKLSEHMKSGTLQKFLLQKQREKAAG